MDDGQTDLLSYSNHSWTSYVTKMLFKSLVKWKLYLQGVREFSKIMDSCLVCCIPNALYAQCMISFDSLAQAI